MVAKHAREICKKPAGVPVTVTIDGALPGTAAPAPTQSEKLVNSTERGNAIRFAEVQKDVARYSYEKKGWFVWTGRVWQDDEGSLVARAMKLIADDVFAEAAQMFAAAENIEDKDSKESALDAAKAHRKWGLRCESRSTIANALHLAQSKEGLTIKLEKFDSEATDFKFNTVGRTLDLQSNKSYDPRREDYITKSSPVVYDKKAKCPRFVSFLEEVFGTPRCVLTSNR